MQSDLPHNGADADSPDTPSDMSAPQLPPSADELTDEEWAELERATDPDMASEGPASEDSALQEDPAPLAEVTSSETVDESMLADVDTHGAGWVEAAEKAEAVVQAEKLAAAAKPAQPNEPKTASASVADEPVEPQVAPEPESTLAMPLPRIIAIANQKGGVGKTTTTVNIAACLAEQGYRTLLVDLDPQANASTGVGLEPRELEHSIYHVMLHDQQADSCIEPTEIKNLFVLPSSLDLAGAEIELVSLLSREHRLRMAIDSVIEDYDYVLIDCPPSLGLLTINALTAAHEVLVPIQCEYYALEGLGQLMRNVDLVKASLNPDLQISHIVLVMFDPRTKLAGQVVDEVRSHFGTTVCQNVIPRTVRLSEAPSFGQPITTFDSDSRGAAAYRAVTQEVLNGQA